MNLLDTIAAVSTPYGKGGIAVLRVSGEDAVKIADRVFAPKSGSMLADVESSKAVYGNIFENSAEGKKQIDDGIAVVFRAPASFTGEDTIEISCHGGVLVTQKVLTSLLSSGARLALPGEFTKRAFINGKITLTGAEGLGDLLEASTDEQIALARSNMKGTLSGAVRETLSVTLKPKYSPLAEGQQVTFNFVLNSGINVYDNASFKEAYENSPAGSVVNVLRNIKMELSADRMIVADGTEITKTWGTTTYTFTTPKGTVAPKQNGDGAAVYDRASGNLTINGNYFTADGTQIPLVDNRLDDWQFGTAESGYILPNVQFSLFKFGVDDKTKAIDDVVKMENLYILGNMGENVNYGQNDGETYKITIGGNTYNMLTMGGAAIGVQARYANVVLDNVTIRRCVLGMNVYSTYARETVNTAAQMHGVENSHHGSTVYVKDGLLEQCWANNVYMWGQCIITLDSTTVGVCSGAGIHVDSLPAKGVNSKLIFKNGTTVTNLLEGEETWFKAYNMAPLAKSLKSKVGDGVAYATKEMAKVGLADRQYSVLTKEEGSTKEKMNIAILIKSGGSATGTMWQQNDDEGYPLVEIEGLLYMDLTKLSEYGLPVTTGFEFAKFDTSDIEGMGGGNLIAGYVGLF